MTFLWDQSRFTLRACDNHKRVWRCHGKYYTACSIIHYDYFGSGSVSVWASISLEGYRDLHFLLGIRMKSHCYTLCWCTDLWVPPGAGQFPVSHGQSALSVSWRKGKDGCNFPWCSLDLNLVENLWEIMYWCLNADKKHHRLHSSSLMPWSKSGGRSSRTPSTVSSEWGHKHYWATLWLRLDRPVISGFNFAIWCNLQEWLMIMNSTNCGYVSLFSMNYATYISVAIF